MNEEKYCVEEGFYKSVADVLGTCYDCQPFPFNKRTRWNNRDAGGGRFPGFGIVRRFNADNIHVQLYAPSLSGLFSSEALVLEAIRTAMLHDHRF